MSKALSVLGFKKKIVKYDDRIRLIKKILTRETCTSNCYQNLDMGTYDRLILLYRYVLHLFINCLCLLHLCMQPFFYVMCYHKMYRFLGNSYEIKHVYLYVRLVTLARFRTRHH